ncbi:hypothetical protein EHQ94_08610 [Leptospira meyeri]|uniref:AbiJ-NTD4 domain-containing protein n=1 Tax=Leptospira meyeri TaxID=29508 RepID=UPI001083CCDD|nr:hypothetical protein [Leptospira meyeri]TGM60593.1 hypothetical protein EHQ93_17945 [Leptospira meyeri]TGM68631.1 hypothetical protein EHQ94_08610 [Leptospira meyeri]
MNIPFNIRYGIKSKVEFDENSIPKEFIVALTYFLKDLYDKNMCSDSIRNRYDFINQIKKAGRITTNYEGKNLEDALSFYLEKTEWYRIFNYLEKLYQNIEPEKLEIDTFGNDTVYDTIGSKEKSKKYFSEELNQILLEDSIPFEFSDGFFHRRGKIQTIKNVSNSMKVLNIPKYKKVLDHFNLARIAFDKIPNGDYTNTVKESFCALEALLHIQTGINSSSNFNEALRKITGNELGKMPKIIALAIEKLYAYRGDAQGVAHAAPTGSKILSNEAELILSLIAATITYLISIENEEEDQIPF